MTTIKTMSQRFRDLAAEELIITLKAEITVLRAAINRKDALLLDLSQYLPECSTMAAAIAKELST
jgi:hypothetical protein